MLPVEGKWISVLNKRSDENLDDELVTSDIISKLELPNMVDSFTNAPASKVVWAMRQSATNIYYSGLLCGILTDYATTYAIRKRQGKDFEIFGPVFYDGRTGILLLF